MKPLVMFFAVLLAAVGGGKAALAASDGNADTTNPAKGAGAASTVAPSAPTTSQNTTVLLVLPGTAGPPEVKSRSLQVPVTTMPRPDKPPPYALNSVIALADPRTHLISVVQGDCDFYLSEDQGVAGFLVRLGSLRRIPPLLVEPEAKGLAAVTEEFKNKMPYPVMDPVALIPLVSLRTALGANFFAYGSGAGLATLKAVEVTDGILRLDLLGYVPPGHPDGETISDGYQSPAYILGRPATIWVDLKTKDIIRSIDNGQEMQTAPGAGKPKPVTHPPQPA